MKLEIRNSGKGQISNFLKTQTVKYKPVTKI